MLFSVHFHRKRLPQEHTTAETLDSALASVWAIKIAWGVEGECIQIQMNYYNIRCPKEGCQAAVGAKCKETPLT